jgi:hypothetical protein
MPGLISFDQEIELGDLVRDAGVDKGKFFSAYQIGNLSQLRADQYDLAKGQLTKRLNQNKTMQS